MLLVCVLIQQLRLVRFGEVTGLDKAKCPYLYQSLLRWSIVLEQCHGLSSALCTDKVSLLILFFQYI